jgi:oxygen-independent coproporphyrinogen-3 oxidase
LDRIAAEFGNEYFEYLNKQAQKFVDDGLVEIVISSVPMQSGCIEKILKPTPKGKFLTDGIASDLFMLNSK